MEERENIRERLRKHSLSYVWLISQLRMRGIVTDKTEMSSVISGVSIETGVISSMNSIIIAMCMLFVIGVGVVDSRRMNKVVDTSKDDEDETEDSTAKEGN